MTRSGQPSLDRVAGIVRPLVSPETFVVSLAAGAALLALWTILRFTSFGPRTVGWALANVIAACVLLQFVLPTALDAIGESGIPAATYWSASGRSPASPMRS